MTASGACPHYPQCSGCSFLEVAYAEQLEAKLRNVRRLFERARLNGFDPELIARITPSPRPFGYRNRAKLVPAYRAWPEEQSNATTKASPGKEGVSSGESDRPFLRRRHLRGGVRRADRRRAGAGRPDAAKRIKLGLYRAGSHEVVDIPGCPVQTDEINRAIEVIRTGVAKFGVRLYDEIARHGDLRFVTVRQGLATSELLVGFVTLTGDCRGLTELADYTTRHCPSVVGVVQNLNPTKGNVIFGPSSRLLRGRGFLEEVVGGVRLRIDLTSFFQVNTSVAEKAYEAIVAGLALSKVSTLVDLYCGIGAVALIAAAHVERVIGIEEVPQAVELASAASRVNGIDHVAFQTGSVERRLPMLVRELAHGARTAEKMRVVLNPPRKGVDAGVINTLLQMKPGRIAYLSCSPPTLLRDLRQLVDGGYHLRSVELFDMFPQTEQVETLAILEPRQA